MVVQLCISDYFLCINRILSYPMLRSIAVAYVKPSSFNSMSCTFGTVYELVRLICLFNLRKPDRTELSYHPFLLLPIYGLLNRNCLLLVRTPSSTKRCTLARNFVLCTCDTGKGFASYCVAFSFSLISYGLACNFPSEPSNSF